MDDSRILRTTHPYPTFPTPTPTIPTPEPIPTPTIPTPTPTIPTPTPTIPTPTPTVPNEPESTLKVQFSPEYPNETALTCLFGAPAVRHMISLLDPKYTDHGPRSGKWTPEQLASWKWDGIETKNICTEPMKALCDWLFPTGYGSMRGLEQLYDELKPFADPKKPTVAEYDDWNINVIRHLRRLTGITTPANNNKCHYLKAMWSSQRRHTTIWDEKYPAITGANPTFGPCGTSTDSHCGFVFIPSCEDQAPYLGGESCCVLRAEGEGILGAFVSDMPAIGRLAHSLKWTICTEGALGGHSKPFFAANEFGFDWVVCPPNTNWAELRGRYSGDVNPCP